MATVSVRYIVDDVDAATAFYCQALHFKEEMHPAPTFAMLSRGDLRLVLSAPSGAGGGGQAMPDGTLPAPGGWNRFMLETSDLASEVETLRAAGARFRNDIVIGMGGNQVLIEDPSGNPIELFEPTRREASLSPGESSPGYRRPNSRRSRMISGRLPVAPRGNHGRPPRPNRPRPRALLGSLSDTRRPPSLRWACPCHGRGERARRG